MRTTHDGLRQLRVGAKSLPASLVIWIESAYGKPLLDRCAAPFEQMKHRSALDAVSPSVGQQLLSHFAYLEGKHDSATPSPPRPRAEFKAQPNCTPCTENRFHTKPRKPGHHCPAANDKRPTGTRPMGAVTPFWQQGAGQDQTVGEMSLDADSHGLSKIQR